MALVVKDRVQVTSTTTGTGTFTLGSAVAGFQDFSAIGDGNTCYYAIVGGSEWEVGLGTYTSSGTTLSRDTILESSNSGSAVNFSAGTKNVFVTYPAEKSIYQNASGVANLTSTDVTTALGYTPVTDARTLTINGTSYDLTANRTWSVGTVTSVAALTLGTTGTDLSSTVANGTTTPVITLNVPTASATNRGVLSSADWTTFNNKGSGTVTSVSWTGGIVSVATGTTTPAFTIAGTSGGIPYFSSGTTWASSGALAANALVIGGGAGAAPSTTTTGTGVLTALGVAANGSGGFVTNIGSVTLTNKTISADDNTLSGIAASSFVLSNGSGNIDGAAAQKAIPSGVVVGTTDTQTLSAKTLTGTKETVFTITDGAAFEIDPANGGIQTITLGASRTPKGTNFTEGSSVTLMVNDGTAYTLTWTDATFGASGVIWVGGTAPTLATTGFTVIELWEVGTQVYGALVGNVA